MSEKIPVYAWYFPNWHPDARNDGWHGKGWTEWNVVQSAAKRFDGHTVYHPLWGYEDESKPEVMEKKIDAALSHGVDGFLWDFYWFDDDFMEGEAKGGYRMNALNNGFFGAKNNAKMKIALMWCNHDPIYVHPAPYRSVGRMLLDGKLSPQAFFNGTEYMIKHYFWRENYLRVHGKIYFILWNLMRFVKDMGGMDGARSVLDDFRDRVRKAGLGELYLATEPRSMDFDPAKKEMWTERFKALGVDGCVTYGFPCAADENIDTWPAYPYSRFVDRGILDYTRRTEGMGLPMNITVSQGSDPSPRTVPSDMYENLGYPFSWITDKKNPEDFERALREAKAFFRSDKSTGDFITLSTWNEWTEGNFMEPSVEDGYAYLDAVKRVFVDEV